jgi:hypothetical protein
MIAWSACSITAECGILIRLELRVVMIVDLIEASSFGGSDNHNSGCGYRGYPGPKNRRTNGYAITAECGSAIHPQPR